MNDGHWLNPKTGLCLQVTTHNDWIRIQVNAESIGLSDELYHQIMLLPVMAIDEIRIVALQGGLVRIRQQHRFTAVQFWATPDQVVGILEAVVQALQKLQLYADERLIIDNLLPQTTMVVSLRELVGRCGNGQE